AFSIDNPAPIISSTSPVSVTAGGGDFPMMVNGSNFVLGSTVRVNGSTRITNFVNSGRVTTTILGADVADGGVINITVVNPTPGNPESAPFPFTVDNPVPILTLLVPDNVATGSGQILLTLNGSNFVPSSTVLWNSSTRPTSFVSPTQLTATIPLTDFTFGTVANVEVANFLPGGGNSAGLPFTVNNPTPGALVLNPNSVGAGGAGFMLTVDGSNFVPNSVVRWSGSPRTTTYVSPTQVTAMIPASDLTTAGVVNVTVFNPTPSGGFSPPAIFNITNPLPVTTNLNPTGIGVGSAPFALTVNGSGFVSTSEVLWDGSPRATTFVNSGQLTAQILAADVASMGSVNITVSSPGPGGGTSAPPLVFEVGNPVPVLSSLSPFETTAGPSDFNLVATGMNFVTGAQILFDGVPRATSFDSPTQLSTTVVTADTTVGRVVNVTVFNPAPVGGTSNIVTWAVNNPAPVTTVVESDPLFVGGGPVDFNVIGTGFVTNTVGYWNGSPRPTNVVNSTELSMTLPPSDLTMVASNVPVYFVNPAPGGGQSATTFHDVVNPQPVLTMLTPAEVLAGGSAFTVTVNGSNFVDGIVFKWNDSPRPTTFVSSSECTAQISAADIATAGNTEISASNPPPGGALNSNVINFTRLAPVLTMLTPNTAVAGGPGFTLTVIGENFSPNVVVNWGGSARPTTFVSATECSALISPADIASVDSILVTVVNPGGVDSSNSLSFVIGNPPFGPTAEEFSTSWSLTGPLRIPRSGLTATRLPSGLVLFVGGRTLTALPTNATELFNPETGRWTNTSSTHVSRVGHSATFVATESGGYVLVVGGESASGEPTASTTAEMYDPVAGQWLDVPSPAFAHIDHSATILADGRILISGGRNELGAVTSNVEIFDPRQATWLRTSALNTPRSGHGAVLLADGRVLVVGGSSAGASLATAETYDPVTGVWSIVAPLNIARNGHTTTLLKDGRVLVVGGDTPGAASTAEIFDPATGSWINVSSLETARFGHSAAVLPDGSVLVGGGQTTDGTVLDACEIFDPARGTWALAPNLNQPRTGHAAVVLDDGRLLVAGGQGGTERPKRNDALPLEPRSRILRPQR
ncbi:MAG: kelch repeat-containing protein, partial [Acidobacteriota bacterium]